MLYRYIVIICLVSIAACGRKKSNAVAAYLFFDEVNKELRADKAIQQRCIDRLMNIILLIDNNPDADINFQEAHQLLDNAKAANKLRIENISRVEEYDKNVDYKNKVLDYMNHLQVFYEKNAKEFLLLLEDKPVKDIEKLKIMLQPALLKVKEKEKIMKEAQEEFNYRYKREESETGRVPGDCEAVPLPEVQMEKTVIPFGTKIGLISFSGCDCPEQTAYIQFIGVNTSTGDTVRILSPCLAQDYDVEKAPRTGTFINFTDIDANAVVANVVVLFNKNLAVIEKKNYKTAFGQLAFE